MTSSDDKLLWADNLRSIATLAVIFLHISTELLCFPISSLSWTIGNIYDSSVRFCVPIFVMLTGALVLPKAYELGFFLKKRLLRIVIPFLFWGSWYIYFNLKTLTFSALKALLQSGISYHLWYVYMIIGLYLFIPILSKWVRNASENEILYFLLIWFCTLFLNQAVIQKRIPMHPIDLSYFSGYIGYLVLGFYLRTKTFKRVIPLAFGLIVLGLLITIFGTHFISHSKGKFWSSFYFYLSPNVVLLSSGVFLLVKNCTIHHSFFIKISEWISRLGYGIYLVHVLVLNFLTKFGLTHLCNNPILDTPLTTIICLVFSMLIIYLISKIPFGKYISG